MVAYQPSDPQAWTISDPSIVGGRYRLIKRIGEGAMGEVYAAEDLKFHTGVAVKLVKPQVLGSRDAVERARKEAQWAAAINHDNVVRVYDFDEMPDGRSYLVMDLLEGKSLADVLVDEILAGRRALDLLLKVCRGLIAIHAKGIVHRDLKPVNIYVTARDGAEVPKILDFGIAKATDGPSSTVAGAIFGTPEYMAPEQAYGAAIDHRVDIYAMGVILYEVFAGAVPFSAPTQMAILHKQIHQLPVPPSHVARCNHRTLPDGLEAVILKCLEKDPAMRYQSMDQLVDALAAYAGLEPIAAPRRRWPWRRIALALLAATGAAAGVALALRGGGGKSPPLFLRVVAQQATPLSAELRTAVQSALARHPAVSFAAAPVGSPSYTLTVAIEATGSGAAVAPAADGDTRVSFKVAAVGGRGTLGTATLDVPRLEAPYPSAREREAAIAAAVAGGDVARFLDETVIAHAIMTSGDLMRCFGEASAQLSVDVDAAGRAETASATPTGGTAPPGAAACLDAAARAWRFHRPVRPVKVAFTRTVDK